MSTKTICEMLLKRAAPAALVVVALAMGPSFANAAEKPPTKIALVYTRPDHPYGTHMYEHECNLLAHCLKQTKGVEAIVVRDWPDASQLQGARSIVFYSHPAGDIVFAPEHRKHFEQLMKDGVGFVAIHWATGGDKSFSKDYLKVLGGWFSLDHAGLKVDKRPLEQQDPKHPICRGWMPYDLREEYYLNLKFDDKMHPVLKANVDGKDQVVAWVYERPDSNGGRSFGTTLGHFHENFTIPDFRRAIVNGILWSAHVEVPENGAPVEVTKEHTQLPQRQEQK